MIEYIVEVSEWVIDANGNPPFGKCEEIVRCRDCKHFKSYESSFEPNLGYCREHDREEVLNYRFCAWGERKEQ